MSVRCSLLAHWYGSLTGTGSVPSRRTTACYWFSLLVRSLGSSLTIARARHEINCSRWYRHPRATSGTHIVVCARSYTVILGTSCNPTGNMRCKGSTSMCALMHLHGSYVVTLMQSNIHASTTLIFTYHLSGNYSLTVTARSFAALLLSYCCILFDLAFDLLSWSSWSLCLIQLQLRLDVPRARLL